MFDAATVSGDHKSQEGTLGESEGYKFFPVTTNGMTPGWWLLKKGQEPQRMEPIRYYKPVKGYPDDPND
ncbi:MAG: hypothetical protein QG621_497 [Patescibacteria group bacterium]|nr:hypothetical protein [Patescibacteria group bacterium]